MTIEKPTFPPRAGKPALRLVGGIDSPPSEPESPPPQRKRKKERGPYKQQARKKYQDGLPVIDPAGEEDQIFRHIAEHRAAAAHYDRCVTVEQGSEGKVSDDEYFHLQRNTSNAFDEMMALGALCGHHAPDHAPRPDPSGAIPCLAIQRSRGLRTRLHVFARQDRRPAVADGIPAGPRGGTAEDGRRARSPRCGGSAMSNVVEFPGGKPPAEGYSEEYVDKLHAEAFRDLEGHIGDCVMMASIAVQMAEGAIEGTDARHEKAMFAVFQVAVMLKKLKADYHAAWHGEKQAGRNA
jgi:hypothetical protein